MEHRLPIRVYYEDTDFSGRVYHASYLRFLERGRTEWLRALGFEQRALSGESGLVFAVRSLGVEYIAPALMDDWLEVETRLGPSPRALILFEQRILRGDRTLVEAQVRVVALRNDRPVKPPRELMVRAARV